VTLAAEPAIAIPRLSRDFHHGLLGDGAHRDAGHDIGFVAEEVGQVLSQVVTREADGKNAQGLAYDGLAALTVEAVKDQPWQIDALKAENADIKVRLEAIEALLPKPPKPPAPPDRR
jgi:hypothetical protein